MPTPAKHPLKKEVNATTGDDNRGGGSGGNGGGDRKGRPQEKEASMEEKLAMLMNKFKK